MSNTDTNQASELFELCKEVYERTGWEDTDFGYWEYKSLRTDEIEIIKISALNKIKWSSPLYTSDYLLEKLPEYVIEYDSYYEQDIRNYLCVMKVPDGYVALYDGLSLAHKVKVQRTDTPLKALLKLTIALSEAGELK